MPRDFKTAVMRFMRAQWIYGEGYIAPAIEEAEKALRGFFTEVEWDWIFTADRHEGEPGRLNGSR